MRKIWLAGAAIALATAAGAQQRYSWLSVDGATSTAIGVLWEHGYDDDPRDASGLARVLADCRLWRVRDRRADLLASGMFVGHDYSMVFAVVGRGQTEAVQQVVKVLLDDSVMPTDDALRLMIARAALAADDAEFLYPGAVLATRARAALAAGTALDHPPHGRAHALQALTPGDVRAALARPVAVRGAFLGWVDSELCTAIEQLPWPTGLAVPRAIAVCEGVGHGPDHLADERHSRCDAPYVLAALPAPPPDERAAFAVAIEIAKARLQRRCRLYGPELRARAPLIAWSWLHADPFVRCYRRGESPAALLPGQRREATASEEARATSRELAAALRELHAAPTEKELRAARRSLQAELALPAPGSSAGYAKEPSLLPGKLMLMMAADYHGIDVSSIAGVSGEQVAHSLRRLDPDAASWHALVPQDRGDHGFRQR